MFIAAGSDFSGGKVKRKRGSYAALSLLTLGILEIKQPCQLNTYPNLQIREKVVEQRGPISLAFHKVIKLKS